MRCPKVLFGAWAYQVNLAVRDVLNGQFSGYASYDESMTFLNMLGGF